MFLDVAGCGVALGKEDVKRAVYDFLSQGTHLFHLLRSDGNELDETELTMLNS
jgi:hypothetical protein